MCLYNYILNYNLISLYFVMHRQNTVLKRNFLRKNILFCERIHCLTTAMSRIQLYDMNIKNSYYKKDYRSTFELSIFSLEVCSTAFHINVCKKKKKFKLILSWLNMMLVSDMAHASYSFWQRSSLKCVNVNVPDLIFVIAKQNI